MELIQLIVCLLSVKVVSNFEIIKNILSNFFGIILKDFCHIINNTSCNMKAH